MFAIVNYLQKNIYFLSKPPKITFQTPKLQTSIKAVDFSDESFVSISIELIRKEIGACSRFLVSGSSFDFSLDTFTASIDLVSQCSLYGLNGRFSSTSCTSAGTIYIKNK
jgi:hypothetical protein